MTNVKEHEESLQRFNEARKWQKVCARMPAVKTSWLMFAVVTQMVFLGTLCVVIPYSECSGQKEIWDFYAVTITHRGRVEKQKQLKMSKIKL